MSLGDAGPLRFPSVLLQPLGHLSVFRINHLRAAWLTLSHTPLTFRTVNSITFLISELERTRT